MARESVHQKLLLPLISLVIILCAFILLFTHQSPNKTTDEISNSTNELITYVNKSYGYKFVYPSKAKIEEEDKFTRISWTHKDQYDFNSGIVEVIPNEQGLDASTYASTKICESAESQSQKFCQETVDNSIGPWGGAIYAEEGVSVTYNLYENETSAYIFPYNDKFIIFRFSGETGRLVEDLDFGTIQTIINSLDTR